MYVGVHTCVRYKEDLGCTQSSWVSGCGCHRSCRHITEMQHNRQPLVGTVALITVLLLVIVAVTQIRHSGKSDRPYRRPPLFAECAAQRHM